MYAESVRVTYEKWPFIAPLRYLEEIEVTEGLVWIDNIVDLIDEHLLELNPLGIQTDPLPIIDSSCFYRIYSSAMVYRHEDG